MIIAAKMRHLLHFNLFSSAEINPIYKLRGGLYKLGRSLYNLRRRL